MIHVIALSLMLQAPPADRVTTLERASVASKREFDKLAKRVAELEKPADDESDEWTWEEIAGWSAGGGGTAMLLLMAEALRRLNAKANRLMGERESGSGNLPLITK